MVADIGPYLDSALILSVISMMWRLTLKVTNGPAKNVSQSADRIATALEKLSDTLARHDRDCAARNTELIKLLASRK